MPMHEAGQLSTHHNLLNVTYDIDGDTAHTETYYLFVGRSRGDISCRRPLTNLRERHIPDQGP